MVMKIITTYLPWIICVIAVIFALYYKNISEKDGSTGCYSKDWAFDRKNNKLVRMMRGAKRTGKEFGLLFIDMDNFKEVNDKKGHLFGDDVIKRTVESIRDSLSKKDILIRFGGDEFTVIVYLENDFTLDYTAESIRDRVEQNTRRTVSIGGAVFTKDMPISVEELINIADSNADQAKKIGKNCAII